MKGSQEETQKVQQELKEAAKPLVDFLYKYYHPHATVLVSQANVEVCEGDLAIVNDLRD
jgi:hypothetical protein